MLFMWNQVISSEYQTAPSRAWCWPDEEQASSGRARQSARPGTHPRHVASNTQASRAWLHHQSTTTVPGGRRWVLLRLRAHAASRATSGLAPRPRAFHPPLRSAEANRARAPSTRGARAPSTVSRWIRSSGTYEVPKRSGRSWQVPRTHVDPTQLGLGGAGPHPRGIHGVS